METTEPISSEEIKSEVKFTEEDLYQTEQLPNIFLRYCKKITRDAAFCSFLLFLLKYFNVWENYVLYSMPFSTFSAFLRITLPTWLLEQHFMHSLLLWMNGEVFFFVLMSIVLHELLFVAQNSVYMFFDAFALFSSYKLRRSEIIPEPSPTLIRLTMRNHLVVNWLYAPIVLFCAYPFFKYFGCEMYTSIPLIGQCFFELMAISILTDFSHYVIHRTMHQPSFYAYHKQHHQYKKPLGISADFRSFMDFAFLHTLPTMIGPMVLGSHFSIWFVWLFLRSYESIESHSGFEFPVIGFNTSRYTDYHHSRNLGNYGIGDFWDSIFQTNSAYLRHLHRIKHQQPVHS